MPESWPLTSFEHFMLADDRPSHPMTFWLRLTVVGVVEGPRLVTAVRRASGRHPLLHARLVGDVRGRTRDLSWLVDPALSPQVFVAAEGIPLEFGAAGGVGIDLTREAAVRLFIRQRAADSTWLVQVHHGACDGVGATRFVEDVFAFYDAAEAGPPAGLRPLAPERLAGRGAFHLAAGAHRHRLGKDVARALSFFGRFPRPLAPPRPPAAAQRPAWPASLMRELDQEALAALKERAGEVRGTVNDVLLRDLFQALDDWNRAAGGGRRAIRLAMAMNMRSAADESLPAANVVSMCFLDRGGEALDDAAALLKGIARETGYLKRFAMGHALLLVAAAFGRVRGGMVWMMTPRLLWKCFSTAVLSNLGVPLRQELAGGGLRVARLELLPPVRPYTALAVGAVTYAGRLLLTMHYDAALLAADDAAAVFDAFLARVGSSLSATASREAGPALLKRLVKEHAAKRQGAAAFWSLPIGKHVAPAADFERGTTSFPLPLRHRDEDVGKVRARDHLLEDEAAPRQ